MSSWTPERREKQREIAKQLVEEGRFGGRGRGQGRPRKPRASEKVAELTANEGQDIFDRLMEITRHGKNSESIAAARTLLETEDKERKIQLEEELVVEDMNRNDLLEMVWKQLQALGGNDGITIIEAEFEPIEQERTNGSGKELERASREE